MIQQASAASFNTAIGTCAQTNLINNYYCLCNACDGNNEIVCSKEREQAYIYRSLEAMLCCMKCNECIYAYV